MTNPSPRPALRKAADAEIHPAAPRPARSPRPRTDATTVTPVPAVRAPSASEPATVVPVEVAAAPADRGRTPKRPHRDAGRSSTAPKRKFSGSTSDHLRVPDVADTGNGGSTQRSALDALFEGQAAAAPEQRGHKDRPSGEKGKKSRTPNAVVDLMAGKVVDLDARVPKALRKAVRDEAKDRGLDVDAVVTDLLYAWVTGRR